MTTPTLDHDPNDVAPAVAQLDTIVSLGKRRGFIYPSSEIYGGINAVWDYGPLGVELKNNVKRAWWRSMVQERDDIVGLDAGILMHPQVWVTSGHVGSFSDPLVECATDHRRFRLDELPGAEHLTATELRDPEIVEKLGLKCPVDGGPLSKPRQFNLMFKTFMGPIEEDASVIYLRPETAQGSYVNFKNVQQSSRKKLPFGIAQIGKSFRNEISPGNSIFRTREFEQMEMQYFVRPDGGRSGSLRGLAPASAGLVQALRRHARTACACASTRRTSWPTTRRRRSTSNTASRSAGRSSRASTTGATSTCRDIPRRRARSSSTSIRRPTNTSSRGSWRRPPARTGPRSRSSSTRTARRRSGANSACRWPSTRTLRRTRWPSCRCSRSDPRSWSCATGSRPTCNATRWPSTTTRPPSASSIDARTRSARPWCVTVDVDSLEDGAVTVRDRDTMTQERIPVEGITRLILDRLDAARAG